MKETQQTSSDLTIHKWLPWTLLAAVIGIPFILFGSQLGWNIERLTWYSVFPLLGIWAWSVMWTHYVLGAMRLSDDRIQKNRIYSVISGYIVLACLLLHPGILALLQFSNDLGLPPQSFYSYVAPTAKAAVMLGAVALFTFLSYEVFERMRENKTVKTWWPIISLGQIIAMTFIFVHALQLGQHLGSGWFQFYWVALGALLIPCFVIILRDDWSGAGREQGNQEK